MDYKQAGVNIDKGNKLVELIKPLAKSTRRPEVMADIGGFSALFDAKFKKYKHPVLVSSCDGVGTKLKLAFLYDKHTTVGIDLVAMGVNDLITCGAEPLFFLDYFASGKLNINLTSQVIKGISEGCRQAGCTLIGGETAEMPGFYSPGEYDLAGFCVGVVEKDKIIDGKFIKAGDIVLGLPSTGPHSNGYSLIRKVFSTAELKQYRQVLFAPTKIYVKEILSTINHPSTKSLAGRQLSTIKGIAHITGGGFIDNIPRILPSTCQVVIHKNSWRVPEIFKLIQKKGQITEQEMYHTFNMGIGLVLIIDRKYYKKIKKFLPQVITIGEIVKGNKNEVKLV